MFGIVHDASKLPWTNLTSWARALGSDEHPPAAPLDVRAALASSGPTAFKGAGADNALRWLPPDA